MRGVAAFAFELGETIQDAGFGGGFFCGLVPEAFGAVQRGLFHDVADLRHLIDAHEGIDFRQQLG